MRRSSILAPRAMFPMQEALDSFPEGGSPAQLERAPSLHSHHVERRRSAGLACMRCVSRLDSIALCVGVRGPLRPRNAFLPLEDCRSPYQRTRSSASVTQASRVVNAFLGVKDPPAPSNETAPATQDTVPPPKARAARIRESRLSPSRIASLPIEGHVAPHRGSHFFIRTNHRLHRGARFWTTRARFSTEENTAFEWRDALIQRRTPFI
jgi:hypothetical protein